MRKFVLSGCLSFVFVFNAAVLSAYATENKVSTDARKGLAVAIYNNDLALVKDIRSIPIKNGINDVSFVDVSAQIRPETALFKGNGFVVLEQDFNFDLLSPSSLLDKFVGKEIRVASVNPATGVEKVENAVVLSNNQGTVLKIGDRIETDFNGRFIFPTIPNNLRNRPTLSVKMASNADIVRDVELDYLTSGLSWNADYVAELDSAENNVSLNGWVTLTNTSGVAYDNATLQLVAGDVNRVQRAFGAARMNKVSLRMDMVESAAAMQEESFMDYHLYSLNRKTSIRSNQTKQVSLLSASNVAVTKEYRLDNLFTLSPGMRMADYPRKNPGIILKLVNKAEVGLGMPIPAGVFRVYKADSTGRVLFVGEDRIPHTPKGEEIKLNLGQAFDVTAKVKVKDFKKMGTNSYKASIEILFKNAKDSDVVINYYQSFPLGYELTSESVPSKKADANRLLWEILIPKNADKTLSLDIFVAGN